MVGAPIAPAFSVLVLTEDGSPHAPATIVHVVKKLFRYLDPDCQTHRIHFEPANDEARQILSANQFKCPRHRHLRLLYGYIATALALEDRFVVHHVDADRTWAERTQNPSENAAAVQRDILSHVRIILQSRFSDETIARLLSRYLNIIPYWEIEAWLYQNTEAALKFCKRLQDCRCTEYLVTWRDDRTLLDEQPDPSDLLCFGKNHNDDLVTGYPTREVIDAGKSLAAALDTLLACDELLDALERTHSPSAQAPP